MNTRRRVLAAKFVPIAATASRFVPFTQMTEFVDFVQRNNAVFSAKRGTHARAANSKEAGKASGMGAGCGSVADGQIMV
jgi:hypothetical protein